MIISLSVSVENTGAIRHNAIDKPAKYDVRTATEVEESMRIALSLETCNIYVQMNTSTSDSLRKNFECCVNRRLQHPSV